MENPSAPLRRLMSCLGDPSRFELVRRLARGQLCVSDLAREVGLSQSCTTRHLQALRRERLVVGERDGKRVLFRLSLEEPHAAALLTWVMSGRAARPLAGRLSARPARPARSRLSPRVHPPKPVEREGPHRTPSHQREQDAADRAPGAAHPLRPTGQDPGAGPDDPGPIAQPRPGDAAEPRPSPIQARRSDIEDYLL